MYAQVGPDGQYDREWRSCDHDETWTGSVHALTVERDAAAADVERWGRALAPAPGVTVAYVNPRARALYSIRPEERVEVGAVGVVAQLAESTWARKTTTRARVRQEDEREFWTAADNLEVCDPWPRYGYFAGELREAPEKPPVTVRIGDRVALPNRDGTEVEGVVFWRSPDGARVGINPAALVRPNRGAAVFGLALDARPLQGGGVL